ncbi:phage integrase family protein [Carnobacterium maltaromaticum]|uniref:phage integrase family protein n=1 Tax=Carnobacterium maltaromaticum TaxID=2751 RepID=UPI00026C8AF2|nr:phage integrase family protein [Carnobacterium maltaromaticum]
MRYCQQVENKWHESYKQYQYFCKAVGQVLQFGVQLELLDLNPMRKTILPRKKEFKEFPNFMLETFFERLDDHIESSGRTSTKLLAFFQILAFTGLRKPEVLSLQQKDVDILNQELTVEKTLAMDEYNQIIIQEPKTVISQRKIKLDVKTIKTIEQWRND